ncbi:hypothetical protein H4219_001203 [Mycoemilia scoparia]|uniref:DH domain-containing protein n=1 Tax=Mycoemilia scoparia TaxID=417184 RepID=A0A9W8A7A7_9FUNG|nr:hypothetical protein H4219_001203 [Mycoemilia scoparia]
MSAGEPSTPGRPSRQSDDIVDSAVWWSLSFNSPGYQNAGSEGSNAVHSSIGSTIDTTKYYYTPVDDNESTDLYSLNFWYNALNPTRTAQHLTPHKLIWEASELKARFTDPSSRRTLLFYALNTYFDEAYTCYKNYISWVAYMQCGARSRGRHSIKNSVSNDKLDSLSQDNQDHLNIVNEAEPSKENGSDDADPETISKRKSTIRNTRQIRDFISTLFEDSTQEPIPLHILPGRNSDMDGDTTDNSFVQIHHEDAEQRELRRALLNRRSRATSSVIEQSSLVLISDNMTEIQDSNHKPFLKHMEPQMIRRHQRVDFVIVGNDSRMTMESFPTYRKFLRVLERIAPRRNTSKSIVSSKDSRLGYGRNKSHSSHMQNKMGNGMKSLNIAKSMKPRKEMESSRDKVLEELVYTERRYVQSLRTLIDVYVVPLRSAARSRNNDLIPPYDAHVIFGNIERILDVNERFLADLEAWWSADPDKRESLGTLCREHFVDFNVYKRYINGFNHAAEQSTNLAKQNPLYKTFLTKAEEREECNRLNLTDMLIMPVQRIPRYTLLLEQILKYTPEDSPDHSEMVFAYNMADEIGKLAENQVAESVTLLHKLHDAIDGCPANIISASRTFIGSIDCYEVDITNKPPRIPITLFIFSDIVMITERFFSVKPNARISDKARKANFHQIRNKPSGSGRPGQSQTSASGDDSGFYMPTGKKKHYRFITWAELDRLRLLEKSTRAGSKSFFLHRTPLSPFTKSQSRRLLPRLGAQKPAHQRVKSIKDNFSVTSNGSSGLASEIDESSQEDDLKSIFFCEEDNNPYWHPQYLHEYELESASEREKLNDLFDTAIYRLQYQPSYTRVGFPSEEGAPEPMETYRISMTDQEWSIHVWDQNSYQAHRQHSSDPTDGVATVVWDYGRKSQTSEVSPTLQTELKGGLDLQELYPHLSCCVFDCGEEGYSVDIPTPIAGASEIPQQDAGQNSPSTVSIPIETFAELCRRVERSIFDFQRAWVNNPGHFRIQQSYNQSILSSLFGLTTTQPSVVTQKPELVTNSPSRRFISKARNLIPVGRHRSEPDSMPGFMSNRISANSSNSNGTVSSPFTTGRTSQGPFLTVLGKYKIKPRPSINRAKTTPTPSGGSTYLQNTMKSPSGTLRSLSSLNMAKDSGTPKSERKVSMFSSSSQKTASECGSKPPSARESKVSTRTSSQRRSTAQSGISLSGTLQAAPSENLALNNTAAHSPHIVTSHNQILPFTKPAKSMHCVTPTKRSNTGRSTSASASRAQSAFINETSQMSFINFDVSTELPFMPSSPIVSGTQAAYSSVDVTSNHMSKRESKATTASSDAIQSGRNAKKDFRLSRSPTFTASVENSKANGPSRGKTRSQSSSSPVTIMSPLSMESTHRNSKVESLSSSPVIVESKISVPQDAEKPPTTKPHQIAMAESNIWHASSLLDDISSELEKQDEAFRRLKISHIANNQPHHKNDLTITASYISSPDLRTEFLRKEAATKSAMPSMKATMKDSIGNSRRPSTGQWAGLPQNSSIQPIWQ